MADKPSLVILRRESGGAGGAERVAARFAQYLGQAYDVQHLHAGASYHGLTLDGFEGSSTKKAKAFAESASKALSKNPADIVLSLERGTPADIYRAGDGVHRRWVKRYHGDSIKQHFNPLHRLMPKLEKISVENSQFVVANSDLIMTELEEEYPAHKDKMHVIYNGFDTEVFQPSKVDRATRRSRIDLPPEGRIMLFAASGWERKGLSEAIMLLSVATHILGNREAKPILVVAGKGKPEEFRSEIKKLGLAEQVYFVGSVQNIEQYYQAADVMVLPTLYDPFSNSCLESLACGCPVMTTPDNGAAEVIQHMETGYVLGRTNTDTRREAVSWWLRKKFVSDAIAKSVTHLDQSAEAENYQKLFDTVLEAKQA